MHVIRLLFICTLFPLFGFGQNDTTYYYGINGNVEDIRDKRYKIEISQKSKKQFTLKASRYNGKAWIVDYTEKITVKNDSKQTVKVESKEFSGTLTRKFEPLKNGLYRFVELVGSANKRTGITKTKMPLLYEGEIKEAYLNGKLKSVSRYKNNQLLTNKNWLEDGSPYLDNIFYSVNAEPEYLLGTPLLHRHILNTFKKMEVNTYEVEGSLEIGFVVKKDGNIEGIKIEKTINDEIDEATIQAFKTLSGKWSPARLNGEEVNYYMIFPLNIHPQK